jgi:hypothetical protein
MIKRRYCVALATCLIFFSSTSQAWYGFGHMAVAYVAYQKLTPEKKVRVAALLKKNPYYKTKWKALIPAGTPADQQDLMLFMIAATWPDQIKSDPAYNLPDGTAGGNRPPGDGTQWLNQGYGDLHRHKYWHFIDMPFSQDGTALEPIPTTNAETEIAVCRQTLTLTSTSSKTDKLKSYDLVWLLHLVGDVHQPLHSTARVSSAAIHGDDGGNSVKLNDPSKELHAFWDGLPGDGNDLALVIQYAKTLAPADPALAQKTDAADWISESFDLARSFVYSDPIGPGLGPFTITDGYRTQAHKIANERVELAGERLANLINNELK